MLYPKISYQQIQQNGKIIITHSGLAKVLCCRKAMSTWSNLTSVLSYGNLLKPIGMPGLSLSHQHQWPVAGVLCSPCLVPPSLVHLRAEERKAESYVQLDKSTQTSRRNTQWWWTALCTTHRPVRDSGTIK